MNCDLSQLFNSYLINFDQALDIRISFDIFSDAKKSILKIAWQKMHNLIILLFFILYIMTMSTITPEVYRSLEKIRQKSIKQIIEPISLIDTLSPITKIISDLIENNSYEVFGKSKNKIFSINILDILSIRDINKAKLGLNLKYIPSVTSDQNLGHVVQMMSKYGLRSIPIFEDGEVMGQISSKTICEIIDKSKTINISIADIMTPKLLVAKPDEKISFVRTLMQKNRIDHVPIIDTSLKGMVTSFKLLSSLLASEKINSASYVAEKINRLDQEVMGIADHDVIVSNINENVNSIIKLMRNTNSTYSLISDGNHGVNGIITYSDLLGLLGERITEESPIYIMGLPDDPHEAQLVKSKFISLVKFLKKVRPDIEESRCKIKIKDIKGKKMRYELSVNILTTKENYSYSINGWELPIIFDKIKNSMQKRLASNLNKKQKRQRDSERYRP